MLTTPRLKKYPVTNHSKLSWTWTLSVVRTKQWKRDMKSGRSLYGPGSLTAAARELARYILDLFGVQEVSWDKGSTVRAGDCNFFYGKGNENRQFGTGLLYTTQ